MLTLLLPASVSQVVGCVELLASVVSYIVPLNTDIFKLASFTLDVGQQGLVSKLFSMATSREEFQLNVIKMIHETFNACTATPPSYGSGTTLYTAYTWLTSFYSKRQELQQKEFRGKNFAEMNAAINRLYDQLLIETGGISSGEWVVVEHSDVTNNN